MRRVSSAELVLAAVLCLCLGTLAQTTPPDSEAPILRTGTQLVLVDVIPEYLKADTQARSLLFGLKREDFRVFDNRKEMPIQSFDVGANNQTRPIALWLIVQCPMGFTPGWASDFLRGKAHYLKPALAHLGPKDVVGVAHWCDNGKTGIDVPPGRDAEGVVAALEQLLGQRSANGDNRSGELAMQKLIRVVVRNSTDAAIERFPVLVFLYGDHSGAYRNEADDIIADILRTSGIVFGISDNGWRYNSDDVIYAGTVNYLAHYYSLETGGGFYTTDDPKLYSSILDYILSQVTLRYTLGFKPLAIDGKRHTIKVELTKDAQSRYKGTALRFRKAYVAAVAP